MHGSRGKIHSKKITPGSVVRGDLIRALKGYRIEVFLAWHFVLSVNTHNVTAIWIVSVT
jgi:hypothetical protein